MQLIVLLWGAVYWGKILFVYVFPSGHAVWYYFTFLPRQLLGYELEEKQYKNFPPWSSFFPTCDRKILMGERKMVFFSHFHI
jgi:hypothetical protein